MSNRGFNIKKFTDSNGQECTLQVSSAIRNYPNAINKPGTSAVWLGIHDVQPLIMASDAIQLGLNPNKTCGYVPFELPKEVYISSRMHLDRDQVQMLIDSLTNWLKDGSF